MQGGVEQLLSGWGRTAPSRALVVEPPDAGAVVKALQDHRHAIGRGLGRSYGDAAQCAGGIVVGSSCLQRIGAVDAGSGLVRLGAGSSLDAVMQTLLPHGWFVPVTPGTRQVTVGGAIAADIHGKNHHRDGGFCRHVTAFSLATPQGVLEVTPDGDPDLFWATSGGMGLTGIVTEATVRMIPVETTWMLVDTERAGDLDAVMATMESSDRHYRYSVAWVDCTARGRHLGRAVLTRGDHAALEHLPRRRHRRARALPASARLRVPCQAPGRLLNATTIAAYNEVWYRKAPRRRLGQLQRMSTFFHPLDGIMDWNLLYGPRGFVQYQFAVGPAHAEVVRRAIGLLSDARLPSFLAVLKRFGPGDPGPLSFPIEGWTLALDLPVGPQRLPGTLDRLDELVAEAQGRVYLAKDARLRRDLVRTMYPRLDALATVRERVDPAGVLCSDLSRRLGLDAASPDTESLRP